MELAALRRYIALALSWQEKLQQQAGDSPEQIAARKRAAIAVKRLRENAEQALARHTWLEQAAALEQQTLPTLLEQRKLTPRQANEQNRNLIAKIAKLQAEITALRELAQAKSASEAGGFVDLPLDAYPEALQEARVTPASGSLWQRLDAEDRRTILVTLAVLLVGMLLLFYFMRWRDQTRFEMVMEGTTAAPQLLLHCHSNEPFPVYLLMPWHDADSITSPVSDSELKFYQVSLAFRFDSQEPFRTLPPTEQAWQHDGQDLEYAGPVRILPQLSETLRLELGSLRESYPDAIGMRLQVRSARDRVVFSETVTWQGS